VGGVIIHCYHSDVVALSVDILGVRVCGIAHRLYFDSRCCFQTGLLFAFGVHFGILALKFVTVHVMLADASILRMTRLATTFAYRRWCRARWFFG
jgi:hypothetical protein